MNALNQFVGIFISILMLVVVVFGILFKNVMNRTVKLESRVEELYDRINDGILNIKDELTDIKVAIGKISEKIDV